MSQWQLSAGVCEWLNDAPPEEINELAGTTHSMLQVLSIKLIKLAVPSNIDRYRIILSDGTHWVQAMLAPDLNEPVSRGEIPQHSIIMVHDFRCHISNGARLIMVHEYQLVSREKQKIGSPVFAPLAEAFTSTASKSTDVPMDIVSEPSTSTGVKLRTETTRPISPRKPGRSVIPIEELNTYKVGFTIKALVTHKSDIRTWSNARGDGKRFSVTFMDESGEISATGFTAVVDDFYDRFEENKVYYVSKVRVVATKDKFSKGRNPYELYFEKNTEVEECLDATDVPMMRYNFVPLSSLEQLEKDSTCDVLGIVTEVGPLVETIARTTNRAVSKRDLTIVDKSLYSVRLTIWGKEAETFNGDDVPVVAFKSVRVSDFGGRSLSMVTTSYMSISPNTPEAQFLRGWYDMIGIQKSFQPYSTSGTSSFSTPNRSEMRHISSLVESELQLGSSDKIEFSTCGTVMRILEDKLMYPACPACSKKVAPMMDSGDWWCEKCQKTFSRPEHRYRITMSVGDWSGQTWFTGFDQVGLAVLGKTANEVQEIRERNEDEYKAFVLQASRKTYNFKCVAQQDTYKDRRGVKYDVTKISPLDYYEEAKRLRDLLMQRS